MNPSSMFVSGRTIKNGLTVTLKLPTTRYADEFLSLKRASDLLEAKLFPNFKEITESMAAYNAVRANLWKEFPPGDRSICLYVVGDGCSPRTAALFAFRTAWRCVAIDPRLTPGPDWEKIQRLWIQSLKIEDCAHYSVKTAIIVAVHSHAELSFCLDRIKAEKRALVAIPCCVPQNLKQAPDVIYEDWGCWSPERTVMIWKKI